MLKYTKYILGATFVCLSTLTVVYAALPKESRQDKADFIFSAYGELKASEQSKIFLSQSQTKNSTDIAEEFPPVLNSSQADNFATLRNNMNDFMSLADSVKSFTLSTFTHIKKILKPFLSLFPGW